MLWSRRVRATRSYAGRVKWFRLRGGLRQTATCREGAVPYLRCMCSWQVLPTLQVHLLSTGETVRTPQAPGRLSRWECYLRGNRDDHEHPWNAPILGCAELSHNILAIVAVSVPHPRWTSTSRTPTAGLDHKLDVKSRTRHSRVTAQRHLDSASASHHQDRSQTCRCWLQASYSEGHSSSHVDQRTTCRAQGLPFVPITSGLPV